VGYDVVAIIARGEQDFPPFQGRTPGVDAEFWVFANALRNPAGVSSTNPVPAFGGGCFYDRGGDAVILYLHDWKQFDEAIRTVGSWLVAHDGGSPTRTEPGVAGSERSGRAGGS
jgi:hypothetical protein